MYAHGAVNNLPSLASSLARPELIGQKRTERDGTERNGTAKKRGKLEEKRGLNGQENRTGRKQSVFLMPTVR